MTEHLPTRRTIRKANRLPSRTAHNNETPMGTGGDRQTTPLTEPLLAAIAGWPVVFEARNIRAAGRVKRASYDPPLLKGAVRAGSRLYASGLRITSPSEVENICSCHQSQVGGDGMICAHSIAVALEVIHAPDESPAASAGQAS